MDWKDTAERLLWTAVSAGLGAAVVVVGDISAWWAPAIIAGINYATLWVRNRLNGLPNPGGGLPGLPT
ncbi:MAG: hypothetical protein ACRDI2_13485 [Chloroflexota bacterium]